MYIRTKDILTGMPPSRETRRWNSAWILKSWIERTAIIDSHTLLPADADDEAYKTILATLPLHDQRDFCILVTIVRDAIMQARREERPTTPLDGFLDWLERYRVDSHVDNHAGEAWE